MAIDIVGVDTLDRILNASSGDEIIGALDLIGADINGDGADTGAEEDDIRQLMQAAASGNEWAVGAVLNRVKNRVRQKVRINAQQAPQGGFMPGLPANVRQVQLRQTPPTSQREYPLGIKSAAIIPAGTTADITGQPQVIFRAERLIVKSSIAASFDIIDVKVGKNSQFAAAGPVPADSFSPNAVGIRLKCDTATPGMNIVVTVENTGGADLFFRGAIIGTALE